MTGRTIEHARQSLREQFAAQGSPLVEGTRDTIELDLSDDCKTVTLWWADCFVSWDLPAPIGRGRFNAQLELSEFLYGSSRDRLPVSLTEQQGDEVIWSR